MASLKIITSTKLHNHQNYKQSTKGCRARVVAGPPRDARGFGTKERHEASCKRSKQNKIEGLEIISGKIPLVLLYEAP